MRRNTHTHAHARSAHLHAHIHARTHMRIARVKAVPRATCSEQKHDLRSKAQKRTHASTPHAAHRRHVDCELRRKQQQSKNEQCVRRAAAGQPWARSKGWSRMKITVSECAAAAARPTSNPQHRQRLVPSPQRCVGEKGPNCCNPRVCKCFAYCQKVATCKSSLACPTLNCTKSSTYVLGTALQLHMRVRT
jgi:hypothetical protein